MNWDKLKFWKRKKKKQTKEVDMTSQERTYIPLKKKGFINSIILSKEKGIELKRYNLTHKRIINSTEFLVINDEKSGKVLIDKDFLRNNSIVMIRKENKLFVIPPILFKEIDVKKYGISLVNFNTQKNLRVHESKAAKYRWTLPLKTWDKIAPVFRLILIGIAVVTIAWFILKFGVDLFTKIVAPRIWDCAKVLPKLPIPPSVAA